MTDFTLKEIQRELLRSAYVAFFTERAPLDTRKLCTQHGWDTKLYERALDEGMGITARDSGHYEIQTTGIRIAEEWGLPDPDLIEKNDQIRAALLICFGEVYERDGPMGSVGHREALAEAEAATGASSGLVEANFDYLLQLHLLETHGGVSFFRLDRYHGMSAWLPLKKLKALSREFEAIRALEPQPRGRALEGLFQQLAEGEGWTVDTRVTAPGEEIDLVISREDSFYLVECRWWSDPIGARSIRDFQGKLRERSGVQGIFVSMSGFTKDAQELVERTTSDTPTLLFGRQDAEGALTGKRTLKDLLTEKKRSLVLRRQARWG